ncbi:MAG: NUDIX domain-containing protein [Treponema sp.]|jgi:ADP-ribose pyrophosphatase YjhB (NUDIX family)|nr:NUDIX domain-containing protein [Treponema sp.]
MDQAMDQTVNQAARAMFRRCPGCASTHIGFERNRVFRCPDCGFTYYHNTAAATACVINTRRGILFQVRNKDPGRGKLDLPGGFVDPGEGAFEGLRRELLEELGSSPTLRRLLALDGGAPEPRLFASFPNTYPYKNMVYNTCDLFFCIDAPDLTEADLHPEAAEISAVRFIKLRDLDMEEVAFDSVKKALRTEAVAKLLF